MTFPWRALLRVAAIGAAGALVVLFAGWAARRTTLGSSDADARARVEAEVRSAFGDMAGRLRAMSDALADPDTIRLAAGDDTFAARRLFVAATAAVRGAEDVAITVYEPEGRAIAWAGRPSEVLAERLQGGEAWFLAQGALGLRLVYVRPVREGALLLGIIAAEHPINVSPASDAPPGGLRGPGSDAYRFPTSLGPVSIRFGFEGARARPDAVSFDVPAPSGERLLIAEIAAAEISATRDRWLRATRSLALMAAAVAVVLLAGPLLDWRNRVRHARPYAIAAVSTAVAIVAGRLLMRVASPADWSDAAVFSGAAYASSLLPLLGSPFDFLITALTAGALVALLLFAVEAWRLRAHRGRQDIDDAPAHAMFAAAQIGAGVALAAIVIAEEALVRDTIAHTSLDLLRFSITTWNPARIALHVGLIVAHATAVGLGVLVLRAALLRWRVARRDWRTWLLILTCWALPLVVWQGARGGDAAPLPRLGALAAIVLLALYATRLKARYRHGSQAFRLTLLTLGLLVPAFAFYPTTVQLARQAKEELVETRYAPQALNQRQTVQAQLQQSLDQIDAFPNLNELVTTPSSPGAESPTDRAFTVWQTTTLATYPVTSSVELYGPDRTLVSRFAFNLPEDLTATPVSEETRCDWDLYEEVAPFFAEDRRVLHAGRAICDAQGGTPRGSIIVRAMLDYENLPFISSRSPYVELLRPPDPIRDEELSGRDVEYAVYGWSRTPLYPDDAAWPLPDEVFARVEQDRTPIWAELRRGGQAFAVHLLNDRGGIYALGFPVLSPLGHLVNLAELTVLAVATYLLLLVANAIFGGVGRRGTTAPALLREIRASFYRKLFLAFVAAVFLPVVALALVTRAYVADQMRTNIEQEAVRTASTARRVIEDLVAPRAAQQNLAPDDNLMVWVSRLIDQDVNIFDGPRLLATSERNLFASGLLPTRTPGDVYHALELRSEAATTTVERIGALEYLLAAAPLNTRQVDAMLTVPLTSRQREIDEEIDTLDRRVLLAALLFIIAGSFLGYTMAERIADPVNRLTRATRRIARGDLDARIAATSSDELRRLVEDFNSMASELQRQRGELERTHRLEAWAEMARQVAHEIKNPLTPIQLNAEHLRRVHADRGKPMSPVLEECVATILTQVKLLRQIASEFSSFASSPTARPAPVDVPELLHEIVDPYRVGLEERIRFDVQVPATLPPVLADRTLIARSLTNIVENALHAMPGAGVLGVSAAADDHRVRIRVSDSGVGMDAEALARAFEPYFSTKATGTGLGLPIAKRNVELSGGTISVSSERDRGTTVELALPIAQ